MRGMVPESDIQVVQAPSPDPPVLFSERTRAPGRPQAPTPPLWASLTCCVLGPFQDNGGHQLVDNLHPYVQVFHKHVTHVGGLRPSDGIMVLDLWSPPDQGTVGSGPAPAKCLLGTWHY